MNIYLIATRSSSESLERAGKIVSFLEDLNYSVDRSMLERSFEDEERMGVIETHELVSKSIRNCDLLIAEVTDYSPGIGFHIATAHSQGKNVLCLHGEESGVMPSVTLRGIQSPRFTFCEYKEDNFEDYMKSFLKEAEKSLNKRFILTIDPEIDRYLEWVAEHCGISKAKIVRDSLERTITKNKGYSKFIS